MKYLPFILLFFLLFNFSALGQDDNPLNSKLNRIYRGISNEEAITELNKDIGIDPNNANLFLERADNFLKLKNYESALFDVKSAVSLKPKDLYTLREGVRILIRAGQIYEGMKIAEAIIALDNTKPIGYVARSEVKFADKDYKGAFEDVLKSYEFVPPDKSLDTSRVFFILNVHLKDDKDIVIYYELILEPIEKKMTHIAKTFPLFRQDKNRRWMMNSRHSEDFSQIHFIYYNLIKYYESKKQFEIADEMIERVGEYEPRYLSLFTRLKFNAQRKRYEKVLVDWTNLIEALKDIPDFQCGVFVGRGDFYLFLNKPEEAISDYKSAIPLFPNSEKEIREKIILAEKKIEENKNQQK